MSTHLRVDPVACDGFGYCAELLPELICLDEWGYPMVSTDPVPAHLHELAHKVVADCPRRALALIREPDVADTAPNRVRIASSRRSTDDQESAAPRGSRVL